MSDWPNDIRPDVAIEIVAQRKQYDYWQDYMSFLNIRPARNSIKQYRKMGGDWRLIERRTEIRVTEKII